MTEELSSCHDEGTDRLCYGLWDVITKTSYTISYLHSKWANDT